MNAAATFMSAFQCQYAQTPKWVK